jgi:hypothetical protein
MFLLRLYILAQSSVCSSWHVASALSVCQHCPGQLMLCIPHARVTTTIKFILPGNACSISSHRITSAALRCLCFQLQVLQWCRAQQPACPFDEWACCAAAEAGSIASLAWLRSQKPPCPWNGLTCAAAAGERQQLQAVKKPDVTALGLAAAGGESWLVATAAACVCARSVAGWMVIVC